MRLRLYIFVLAFLVFVACGSDGEPVVAMSPGHVFDPESLTVAPGTKVVFTNDSEEAHTVTAYEDALPEGAEYFSSGGFEDEERARAAVADALIPPGEQYSVTLEEPGTYEYFCIPHEADGMKAEIVVEE